MTESQLRTAIAASFLSGLPRRLLEELLAARDCVDVPAGTTVYRPGEEPRAFLVVAGLLRVYMSSPEGRQVTVRYTRAGDVLGIPVLIGGPVQVGVSTLADSALFHIDPRILISTARRDPAVAWALAEEVNRRLYENLRQTAVNAFGTVRQRVAVHLLDLAAADQQPGAAPVARTSQQELADAVGSVREVVARVLRDFRAAGLVETAPDTVRILDAAALHEECRQ
ncbi:MAG TPA: Crp/Fnr family transcriptional regulator [Jatrophihabitans sp.]|nr:Crp/Fnr family transcriptional regulator [Jatrophihabitans sp.]